MALKLKIDNDDLEEEFFSDAHIIGIVAPQKDYSFIWNVNQMLGYRFAINHNLEIQYRKQKRDYFFSVFEYQVASSNIDHFLYNNQHDGEYLLPGFKHLDFVWIVKGETIDKNEFQQLQHSIRHLASVQLVIEITKENIKNKQSLIL